ncbi:class I SAM-dependent methyltransferase [Nocardioides marinus]|uniref:SAM-dependent methyltransferase n=1 Tax=Nocardioides marinus TaxID=374514 RepID=A0A7Y9YE22_9ACTN|nr:SAM-dependent methyltransferase [Nocardioides marinus]
MSDQLPPVTPDSRDHPPLPPVRVERRAVDEAESRAANGPDWDRYADDYQATHGEFLGDAGFVWGPEGLTEAEAGVLGDVRDKDVLEVGSGAGQCSRWVRSRGGRGVGLDLSYRQLQHSRRLDESTGLWVPSVLGTATALPFRAASFDAVFSSFGALQFVADLGEAVGEVARVLRPGGRFAFSITHPTRWMFPDDPGTDGLVASQSYWDRTPYVEVDESTGAVSYVEHHRTLGDWVGILAGHGFRITDLLEPEWPEGHERVWGGWSGVRGRIGPGTAVIGCDLG